MKHDIRINHVVVKDNHCSQCRHLLLDLRFIWKHSDTYTSVTRGHFLNNIYIQDMTEWTYDEK